MLIGVIGGEDDGETEWSISNGLERHDESMCAFASLDKIILIRYLDIEEGSESKSGSSRESEHDSDGMCGFRCPGMVSLIESLEMGSNALWSTTPSDSEGRKINIISFPFYC